MNPRKNGPEAKHTRTVGAFDDNMAAHEQVKTVLDPTTWRMKKRRGGQSTNKTNSTQSMDAMPSVTTVAQTAHAHVIKSPTTILRPPGDNSDDDSSINSWTKVTNRKSFTSPFQRTSRNCSPGHYKVGSS